MSLIMADDQGAMQAAKPCWLKRTLKYLKAWLAKNDAEVFDCTGAAQQPPSTPAAGLAAGDAGLGGPAPQQVHLDVNGQEISRHDLDRSLGKSMYTAWKCRTLELHVLSKVATHQAIWTA